MSRDIAMMSATDLIRSFAAGTLSPVEATEAALAAIDAHNGKLNAFVHVDAEGALAAAKASEQRWRDGRPTGLIDGVPTTIKDLADVKALPTRRGSKTTDPEYRAPEDAPFVARLRDHGAVFLGKTTTPEIGWKGVTDSPLTGVTRNPWNPEKTPGGSSGGAAVSAATGMGALHQGTDGGGSIRIPAAYTGIYGIKPTFGRVPQYPASAMGTVSHVGPMTRTVADAALMLTVMSGPHISDWYTAPDDGRDFRQISGKSVRGMRIAYCPDLGFAQVDPDIAELVAAAVRRFAELGAYIEEVDLELSGSAETFRIHWFTGAANAYRALGPDQRELLDPGLAEVCLEGLEITLPDYQDAIREREKLGFEINRLLDRYDLLLTPAMPTAAFDAGLEVPPGSGMRRWTEWTPFSYPFNLTQHPAASVPCGFTRDGMPAGLQIVAAKYREDKVFSGSAAYETICPFKMPT
ncbi:amidase [Nisaea acidiphila]|uniref:Amidase n=1 Tax=Nisaea acidiphila TaxID=1862145 RepID=A0A9J7ARE0_9PROT|nr:amidase [Nisaea acidiphila]UUX49774.1 amidase [Nisaea acidiphila]